MPFWEFLFIF